MRSKRLPGISSHFKTISSTASVQVFFSRTSILLFHIDILEQTVRVNLSNIHSIRLILLFQIAYDCVCSLETDLYLFFCMEFVTGIYLADLAVFPEQINFSGNWGSCSPPPQHPSSGLPPRTLVVPSHIVMELITSHYHWAYEKSSSCSLDTFLRDFLKFCIL